MTRSSDPWLAAYVQRGRLFELLYVRAVRRARVAHPETDGHRHLVHNWGNVEARAVWAEFDRRWAVLNAAATAKMKQLTQGYRQR